MTKKKILTFCEAEEPRVSKIPIYADEQDIKDLVSNNVVSAESIYCIDKSVSAEELFDKIRPDVTDKAEADLLENLTKDVKPLSSILVSNIWNKNNDVFTSEEMIKAVDSVSYKPINWMHKGSEFRGNQNIGVMIKASLLKGDIDNLSAFESDDFGLASSDLDGQVHIKQDGVIWSSYFPTYTSNIEECIEEGTLFVSMECFFDDFGYAVRKTEDGPVSFIERNQSNASYSKSLKCFGGEGKVTINNSEYTIGRWLKDITFSGQGIVDKPANNLRGRKLSIIFSKDKSKKNSEEKGQDKKTYSEDIINPEENLESGYNSLEMSTFDKGDNMTATVESLERKVAQQLETISQLQVELSDAKNSNSQAKIDELNETIQSLNETIEASTNTIEELKSSAAKADELSSQLEEANKANKEIQAKLDEIQANEVGRARLVELQSIAGDSYGDDDFEAVRDMDDSTFEAVKAALVKAGVSSESKLTDQGESNEAKLTDQGESNETKLTEAEDASDEDAEIDEATEALDDIENNESDLVVSDNDSEVDADRQAAIDLVQAALSK